VLLLNYFELEPGVVGNLVGEEGDEEGFENRVGEGFVVCALEVEMLVLNRWRRLDECRDVGYDVQFVKALLVGLDLVMD
jgi:hypothetical protein